MSGGIAYVLDEDGTFAKRCNLSMVDLEPVEEEEDLMQRLHHHGGDLETKGRIDILANMSGHDEERLMQLITNHHTYTGSARAKDDPGRLGDLPHEVREGDAGRVPPGAAGNGAARLAGGRIDASTAARSESRRRRMPPDEAGTRRDTRSTMGKVTGFLEYDRQEQKYQLAGDRVRHFREFTLPLDDGDLRKQAARCMDCGIPFCHGPTGCPVHNQIPDWNDLVFQDDWEEAARNLHSTNNFPEFTGRICPAPCEEACTLNLENQPVTIKTIEQAIADKAWEMGWVKPEPAERLAPASASPSIGSGPAGLAAAQQLARVGHEVHVFEREAKPGGLLRYGIPDFKMEKHHIDRRVKQMEAEGVVFHCGVECRRDRSLRVAPQRVRRGAASPAAPRIRATRRSAGPGSRRRAFRHALPRPVQPARERRGGRPTSRSWPPASTWW